MFGDQATTTCLYGPSNYTTVDVHPPVVGFAYDGFLIYGRYLSESAPVHTTLPRDVPISKALPLCAGHFPCK